MFLGIVSAILFVAILCLIIHIRVQLFLTIELIKESLMYVWSLFLNFNFFNQFSFRAVSSHPTVLFFPLVQFVLQLVVFTYFGVILMKLVKINGDLDDIKIILYLFYLLQFYWLVEFIRAFNDFVLAGVFGSWYWTFDKKEINFSTLGISIWRTIRFF